MSPLLLCSVSILMLTCTFTWAAQKFVNVTDCPKDANEWNIRSEKKNCYGDTPDFLCAAIEKKVGKFGEICTKYGLTPKNKCAVLNAQTHNLDSVDCKADSGCPTDPYIPSELWKYTICYRNFYEMKTTSAQNTIPTITTAGSRNGTLIGDGSKDGGSSFGAEVAIAVVIILIAIIVMVVVLVVFYKRNQFGFKDKIEPHIKVVRKRFQHSDSREVSTISDMENANPTPDEPDEPLLPHEQEEYAKSDKKKSKKGDSKSTAKEEDHEEQEVYAKPDKKKSKKEKAAECKGTDKDEDYKGKSDENIQKKQIEKLKELLKYLVHILKQELCVNDLKEKIVIHSKSVKEHFTEPLQWNLQNVKNASDYSGLDMSLVFTLLHNFCGTIKPSSKGWDYEPPDEETHVGADIERIRFMWNRYCDDKFEFKHLDDVYNRMKNKYGTAAVHGNDGVKDFPSIDEENTEGFEIIKDKVQCRMLNPDCIVEKGIVITEGITEALKILKSRNTVILIGVIGCGKTYALKAIQNHFHGKGFKIEKIDLHGTQGEISREKPTLLLCDNLFGRFGGSVFSQADVDYTGKVLEALDNSKGNVKIVVGIHTHIYDEVKKISKLNFLHKKKMIVEIDKLSEAETLLIFKEQLKRGHCKMDSDCWFKKVGFQSVLEKLSKNQGQIGGPFLSLMYCNQHELFSDDAFSVNPIQTMMQYFQRMQQDSPTLYCCLLYLMCFQQHNYEEEPKPWDGKINEEITKEALREIFTSGFVLVEAQTAALAHDILTIVLFKSAAVTEKYLSLVVQNSEVDMMLQLFRPPGTTHNDFYCDFMDVNKDETLRSIGKELVYRYASKYQKDWKYHPLLTIGFVKEKYSNYLKAPPKHIKKSK